MASHFSSLGMPIETEEDLQKLLNRMAKDARVIDVEAGRYLCWTSDSGAETWVQLTHANEFVGFNPHYAGKGRMPVRVQQAVDRPESTALDGAYYAWANPQGGQSENGDYPFVFDVPDFQVEPLEALPWIGEAQLAAFSEQLKVFRDEEAFVASQTEEPRFASRCFIPTGLLKSEEDSSPPQAFALINGRIREAARLRNELTGGEFVWLLVDTLGGSIDVVADFELLPGGVPRPGEVVSGTFWMSGRVLDREEPGEDARNGSGKSGGFLRQLGKLLGG